MSFLFTVCSVEVALARISLGLVWADGMITATIVFSVHMLRRAVSLDKKDKAQLLQCDQGIREREHHVTNTSV